MQHIVIATATAIIAGGAILRLMRLTFIRHPHPPQRLRRPQKKHRLQSLRLRLQK